MLIDDIAEVAYVALREYKRKKRIFGIKKYKQLEDWELLDWQHKINGLVTSNNVPTNEADKIVFFIVKSLK